MDKRGSPFLQTQNGRYHEDVRHCYCHDTEPHSHIDWFLVRAQRSNRRVSAIFRNMAAVALSSEKINTSSHSVGRREKCADTRKTMLLIC